MNIATKTKDFANVEMVLLALIQIIRLVWKVENAVISFKYLSSDINICQCYGRKGIRNAMKLDPKGNIFKCL